jgi:hypothetical protein
MKTSYYWFFAFIAVLMWNVMMIKRDAELFKAYDKACAELPKPHPNCKYAK